MAKFPWQQGAHLALRRTWSYSMETRWNRRPVRFSIINNIFKKQNENKKDENFTQKYWLHCSYCHCPPTQLYKKAKNKNKTTTTTSNSFTKCVSKNRIFFCWRWFPAFPQSFWGAYLDYTLLILYLILLFVCLCFVVFLFAFFILLPPPFWIPLSSLSETASPDPTFMLNWVYFLKFLS